MKKRARQSDVAALAKVSPAIVSLVLNGRVNGNVRISEETQQRVLDAVRQLGYVANPVARKLAGNQNRMLGIFTYEAIFPLEYRNFYYPFLIGIEEEAQVQDYDLLLFTRASAPDAPRSIYKNGVNSLQVADGAILLGVQEQREELLSLLQEGFPFVFIGRRVLPEGEVPHVAADYTAATQHIVEYIAHKGHRRLVFLRNVHNHETTQDRESGYRKACISLKLSPDDALIHQCETKDITLPLIEQWLEGGVTAFVAENIARARRVLDIATALGKLVPRDFSLAVLGDPMHEGEKASIPDVTTFLIPRRQMGCEAVRLLTHMLAFPDDPGPHHVTLPCTFVEGKTVAALNTRKMN